MFLLVPGITSIVLFLFLWREDLLPRPLIVGGCVLISLAVQVFAPRYSTAWFCAAFLNVAVAIYLAIRLKLSL